MIKMSYSIMGASLLLSTSLWAQPIALEKGWQLLGAVETIDPKSFDNRCVDHVWTYKNSRWKIHIANGKHYDIPSVIGTIDQIEKGQGFWVYAHDTCHIDTNTTDTNGTWTSLLAGKTFYIVTVSDGKTEYFTGTFNDDLTVFTTTEDGSEEENPIQIDGDTIYFTNDTDGSYTVLKEDQGHIYADDRNKDGLKDGFGHLLFDDETTAKAYRDTLKNLLDNGFTTDYLNGKTLYYVAYDDFGGDTKDWQVARMQFTDDQVTWTELTTDDNSSYTFGYTIENGKIVVNEEHFDPFVLKSIAADYLRVCSDSDCDIFLFFDLAKAKAHVIETGGEENVATP